MTSRLERLLIALIFALLAAGITLIVASAQVEVKKSTAQSFTQDCAMCHTEFQTTWQSGAHGQAASDPIFVKEWTAQGKPGACLVCHTTGYDPATATYKAEGVTCEACHGPASPNHPKEPMPVNTATDLCGSCHSDTRFGWQDWKVSTHYQRGMDCATCHDPHSAALKKVSAPLGSGDPTDEVSQLCINCHKENNMGFSNTAHHQQGVSCVDCHVNRFENTERVAHTVPDHSFAPNIETCNTCHADEMHKSSGVELNVEYSAMEEKTASLSPKPESVSPIGFSILAGMIGLAGGMVLAPWLERWYRQIAKHDTEDNNG